MDDADWRESFLIRVNAGAGLLVIYGGLLYTGATGSSLFPKNIDSTLLVIALVDKLLGTYGTIGLAICVALQPPLV